MRNSFIIFHLEKKKKKKKKIEHDVSVSCSAAEAVETAGGFHVPQFRCSGGLVWCLCSLYNSGLLRFRLSAVPVI